jgi:hypothetical protein
MLNSKKKLKMKKFKLQIIAAFILVSITSCDKGFEELNINPYALTSLEPALLLANSQRLTHSGSWEGEQTIVQQYVNAYNLGATAGFNFNENNNNFNVPKWNEHYPGPVKLLTQALELTKDNPNKTNLQSQIRIWRAYVFMTLVDTYGHVPYSEAGKAFLEGNFYPKYDLDSDIYNDLYNEIKSAAASLDPTKDKTVEDLFYGKSATTAIQVTKWKRLAYSLMLRLGMRYTKIDEAKARSIVQEAYNGGVMQDNSDNAFLLFNSIYNNPRNQGPRSVNPYFYYLAEPFVNHLKLTRDPRLKYIGGKYSDPNSVLTTTPNTDFDNQFGFPVGYDQTSVLTLPGYRGTNGTGQNYTQLNFSVAGSAIAPTFFMTNAQVKLLLAEAAHRGWLTGLSGAQTAQQYYELGIRASFAEYALYPNVSNPAVSNADIDAYLQNSNVVFSSSKALELINTQYWVVSFGDGTEVYANFRRSGFPVLAPNRYNTNLQNGFARRFAYPNEESARNNANFTEAVGRLGGSNNLSARVFWDK